MPHHEQAKAIYRLGGGGDMSDDDQQFPTEY